MGVAVITSTSGAVSAPFFISFMRCSTPKRCCSSTMTRPSLWNSTFSSSSAWVPITSWALPCAMCRRVSRLRSCSMRAGQQHDAVAGLFQDSPRRQVVLGRQNLRRRHHRHLVAVLHGDDGGFESDDGLARADVALQQAPHGRRLTHVVGNFLQHALLGGGRVEWQDAFQRLADGRIDAEAYSRQAAHAAALQLQPQFEKKQLLEDEAEMRRRARRLERGKAFAGIGPVGMPERLEARNEPEAAANRRRNGIGKIGIDRLQRRVDDPAEPAGRQPARALVNGHDAAHFQRMPLGARIAAIVAGVFSASASSRISNCG